MNLIHEEITHKVYGEGDIVDQDDSFITVDFEAGTKKFIYPDAFGKFITLNDPDTSKSMKNFISKRKVKKQEMERQAEAEKEQEMLEQQRREKMKNHNIHESSQIAFWLDEEEQANAFTDWNISTGTVQSGKNKGQPNKASRVRPNSAGLLTARGSDQPETERKILGLYMVHASFFGNSSDDGMIPAHAEYRIELSEQEAAQMLFWNYYINKTYPHRMTWNSGRFRYFDNEWTARILKDIIALKTDEDQIKQAENFLEYFCQMNALNINNIPEASGALQQQ